MTSAGVNRLAVTVAVMIATALSAMEVSIVGTAMPSIIGAIGGFSLSSWVFSGYLLTSATSMPIYGKLADLFGRKVVLQVSIVLFMLASLLSGLSHNMTQLIVFRTIQGLGAGAIIPISTTIIGDLYTLAERGKMQGLLSTVWAVAGLIGPAIGAFIVERWHWGWVFFINLPIGTVAILLLALYLREDVAHRRHAIDWLGAASLAASVTLLLVALLTGGVQFPWLSWPVALAVGSGLLLALFLWQEGRAPEPVLPLELFRQPMIWAACAANFFSGFMLISAMTHLPMFIQGVLGLPPRWAGIGSTLMSVAWPACSTYGGARMVAWGFRRLALVGVSLQTTGAVVLLTLGTGRPVWVPFLALVLMGAGFGFSTGAYIVGVQTSVPWNRRGVATSAVSFVRFLGQTLGIALLGAVVNARIVSYLGGTVSQPLERVNQLLDPATRPSLDPALASQLAAALAHGLHGAFWVILGTTVVTLLVVARYLPARADEPSRAVEAAPPGTSGQVSPP